MKKILTTGLAILIVFGSVYTVYAAQDVVNTKHNLSTSASTATRTFYLTAGTAEVCVFCHTPHFGSTTQEPLWNRTDPGGFTMYTSATIDMTIAASPQGVSLACLSCHDGATAFDSLVNFPGSGSVAPSWTWNGGNNTLNSSTWANIDTDLTNDHPISITYSVGTGSNQDPAFNAPVDTGGGKMKIGPVDSVYLPLYGASYNQVECGSCHDPHEKDNATFLRVLNTASQLCTGCHIK